MSILVANLKHLYQQRLAWLWYLIILLNLTILLLASSRYTTTSMIFSVCIGNVCMGMAVGAMQKDVLTKPFSFCLPGHRNIPRHFVFLVGGIVSFVVACGYFKYPGLGFPHVLLVVLAADSVGIILYLCGAYVGFMGSQLRFTDVRQWPFFIAFVALLICSFVVPNTIISYPIPVIAVGVAICVAVWNVLGRDVAARRYCGRFLPGLLDLNRAKTMNYQRAIQQLDLAEGSRFFERIERFFLGRMKQHESLNTRRYVWGQLYVAFGKFFAFWGMKPVLVSVGLMIVALLALGLMRMGQLSTINILFIMPALTVLGMDLMPCRNILLPVGRAERYRGMLVLAIIFTLSALVWILAMTGVSTVMEKGLPEFSFRGWTFSYHGMDISHLYVYFLCMPLALSWAVVVRRSFFLTLMCVVFVLPGWMVYGVQYDRTLVKVIGPLGVAAVMALCWIGFLVVSRYVCMRRCLVSN